jgi:uncharacterized protein YjbJ (UPF0337 family)
MNKNQIKGSVKDATGKVQQKLGQATGNTTQQVKGVAKQIAGKVEKTVGNVQHAAADSTKRASYKR